MPAPGPSMPHATAMAAPPKAGLPAGAAASKPQDVAGKAATPGAAVAQSDATKGKAASAGSAAAANDAASFSDTPAASNTPSAASETDPTAQAIMAAGAESSAPPQSSSSQAEDAELDSGVASAAALGAIASPAAAVASSAMQAATATAAAVTAATSASIAEALSASAGTVAADKHTRGSGPDFSISGSSTDGTAGAAQLLSSAATSSSDAPTPTFKVPAGVDTAEFGQGVADRVSLMMDSNLTSAKLQVNPPALGPIEVRIALQSGHAQVWFTSHSAVTRDALESSAPKLREMLGAQGFGQVSVDISQRSFQERSPPPKGYAASSAIGGVSAAPVQSPSASSRSANGLLDAYA
jgi:flagellar hook-length control protein FliK